MIIKKVIVRILIVLLCLLIFVLLVVKNFLFEVSENIGFGYESYNFSKNKNIDIQKSLLTLKKSENIRIIEENKILYDDDGTLLAKLYVSYPKFNTKNSTLNKKLNDYCYEGKVIWLDKNAEMEQEILSDFYHWDKSNYVYKESYIEIRPTFCNNNYVSFVYIDASPDNDIAYIISAEVFDISGEDLKMLSIENVLKGSKSLIYKNISKETIKYINQNKQIFSNEENKLNYIFQSPQEKAVSQVDRIEFYLSENELRIFYPAGCLASMDKGPFGLGIKYEETGMFKNNPGRS